MIALLLATSGAHAATLNVDGAGNLLGASGVDVGGILYDVEFINGTCIDLYEGCDSNSDFVFSTGAEASLATQALFDEVFIDGPAGAFLSTPDLTVGCSPAHPFCQVITPFNVSSPTAFGASVIIGFNNGTAPTVSGEDGLLGFARATTTNAASTFVVWSVVPEPGSGLLMLLGLAGLAASPSDRRPSHGRGSKTS